MATINSNSAFSASYSYLKMIMMDRLSSSECIPWLVVIITECLAIVILNIITIIVFVKQRQLQRQSTYLIIHLAIVDLLVGAVSGPLNLTERMATFCDLWEYPYDRQLSFIYLNNNPIVLLFYLMSIVNLAFISLERLHATFCPFQHRLLKKWVYYVIIGVMWVLSISVESVPLMLYETMKWSVTSVSLYYIVRSSLCLLVLVVICASYILIYIKVRCGPYIQHHGAANREKQLTVTLLFVTLVSLLTWLPGVILYFLVYTKNLKISGQSTLHIAFSFGVLTLANSLVNPIMYAIRMPEFRTTVSQLFQRPSGQRVAHPDIQLNIRNM
ncbi:histamine H2 receptor-like [Oculina patagonica]